MGITAGLKALAKEIKQDGAGVTNVTSLVLWARTGTARRSEWIAHEASADERR